MALFLLVLLLSSLARSTLMLLFLQSDWLGRSHCQSALELPYVFRSGDDGNHVR